MRLNPFSRRPNFEETVQAAVAQELEQREINILNNPAIPLFEAGFLLGMPEFQDVAVTPLTITRLPSVDSAITIISETLAGAPLNVMDMSDKNIPEIADDHPVQCLLTDRVSSTISSSRFVEVTVRNCLLWGNSVWYIVRDPVTTFPVSLRMLYPGYLTIRENKEKTDLVYIYQAPDVPEQVYTSDQVVHTVGPSTSGIIGRPVSDQFKDVFRRLFYLDRYARIYFQNSGVPSGILTSEQPLTAEDARRMQNSWRESQGGGRSQGTAVLGAGTTYQPISGSPDEAQLVDVRRFEVFEVARIFTSQLLNCETTSGALTITSWKSLLTLSERQFVRGLCGSKMLSTWQCLASFAASITKQSSSWICFWRETRKRGMKPTLSDCNPSS